MYRSPTIRPLSVNDSICVLRDDHGNSMGTGTREALEVLLYIAEQAKHSESKLDISSVPKHAHFSADVRSALVF